MEWLAEQFLRLNLTEFVANTTWVWPVCEILHFSGMSILIGTVGIVDLRILGVGKGLSIKTLERFIPLGVAAFVVNLLTGILFIAGNPEGGPMFYLTNLSFQVKMALVLIAGINLLIFYVFGIAGKTNAVAPTGSAPFGAKIVASVSLATWAGVILFGRLLMYNDTLLYALGL